MATQFDKEIRPVDITQLRNELNNSANFTATCISIEEDANASIGQNNVIIYWNTDLTASEEIEQDTVCSNHTVHPVDINITELPLSSIEGKKVAVHTSYKPEVEGKTTYATWVGAGDDLTKPGEIGTGELLELSMTPGNALVTKDIRFNPIHGRVWLHEGYLKHEGGGAGDYFSSEIIADATPLQQVAALDLELDGDIVKFATGGPGTGTHGFADATKIALLPRSFSNDGDWDFDGTNLTPNLAGTGQYRISTVETPIHSFVNKIPCCGNSPYFSMSSDETTELPHFCFIRLKGHNTSNSTWSIASLLEIYRERTLIP